MKGKVCLVFLVIALALGSQSAFAQDPPTTYLFTTYYVCNPARQAWMDRIGEQSFGPLYDRQMQAGRLLGWGYLSHYAGGRWTRTLYFAANDLNQLMDARDAVVREAQAELSDAIIEMGTICPEHADYIWVSVAGSVVSAGQLRARPAASYSSYFNCDPARQKRADEIVRGFFAPALNRLEQSGAIKSWNWFAHVMGGSHNRLMTYLGDDHKSLMAALDRYVDEVPPELLDEFRSICGSHQDYLWNTLVAKP